MVDRNRDGAYAVATRVEKESGMGICEKAKWMNLFVGQGREYVHLQ